MAGNEASWALSIARGGGSLVARGRKSLMEKSRRAVLELGLITAACACGIAGAAHAADAPGKFVCPPCGCDAHTEKGDEEFAEAGACKYCSMPLVAKEAPKPAAPKPGAL